MEQIKSLIRNIPDFPKPGIQFKDITTLFEDRWGFKKCIDMFEEIYRYQPIDKIAGIDSRGFILGAALADRLNCGFVTVRKKGKLPWKTIEESYDLEYGSAAVEVHIDAIKEGERVLVVDDLLATGGTLEASVKLVERLKGEVVGIATIIELAGLNGQDKLKGYEFKTLISYDEA